MLLIRTSSHTCGRWYLPIFLLRDRFIDPDEHRFFYQSGEVVFLPSHYTKFINVGIVTSDGTVVIDRGGGLKMFLQPFSKCSSCLTNVFFITLQPITFEPVYYATFVGNVVFYLWEPPVHLSGSCHF